MSLYKQIVEKKELISVIGLGYVGMPLAVAFAKKVKVIGFDINEEKIELYKKGIDPTNEIGSQLKNSNVNFTSNEKLLSDAKFHIVAVPTPINSDKTPDLSPIEDATNLIGRNIKKGSIVVYESTVYPGITEDFCIPILEKTSGLKCGIDFKVGYSPERINPGDTKHKLNNIIKIVSGIDNDCLGEIAKVYELIVESGVYKAESIKVAEAAKVVENSQRDINIAFMNEISMVFNRMDIDTLEVINAMNTKWNSLGFYPGLVGGHCIGVDPYYFLYKAERLGYHSQIVISGRKINDNMPNFIVENIIKKLIVTDKIVKKAKILILGIAFKEDTPDIRNTKVLDIIKGLKSYGVNPLVIDPIVNRKEAMMEYDIDIKEFSDIPEIDCIVLAVAHKVFRELSIDFIDKLYKKGTKKVLIDVKSIFEKNEIMKRDFEYWRL